MRSDPALPARPAAGFSLVELLIAITLGLLLLTAIGALFLSTSRNYRENELVAGMQDQARFALATLSRDFAMAGYWGGMLGTGNIVPNFADTDPDNDITRATIGLTPAQDCGPAGLAWSFFLATPMEFRNQDSGDALAARWNCIGHQRAGTDVVALRHVAGQPTGELAAGEATVRLRPHHFYLQTNGTVGTLTRWGAAAEDATSALELPDLPPMSFHRYVPRIYFVRDFSITPGDDVPALCRKVLCPSGFVGDADPELASCDETSGPIGASGWYSECIAEGVEDFQVLWGLDSADDSDAVVDRYTATPTDLEVLRDARSVQLQLLVRSRQANPRYRDTKTYRLGDKAAFTPSSVSDPDGTEPERETARYYRRIYSTTVLLRNMGFQDSGNGS